MYAFLASVLLKHNIKLPASVKYLLAGLEAFSMILMYFCVTIHVYQYVLLQWNWIVVTASFIRVYCLYYDTPVLFPMSFSHYYFH